MFRSRADLCYYYRNISVLMKYQLWQKIVGSWIMTQELSADVDLYVIGKLHKFSPVAISRLVSYSGRRPVYIKNNEAKLLKKAT